MADTERERDLLRAALGRTPACPDIETLATAAPGSSAQRHAASCEHCRAEIALLHQFENAHPAPDEAKSLGWVEAELTRRREAPVRVEQPAREPRQSRVFAGWRVVSWLAACAALAVAIMVYQRAGDTGATINNTQQPVWRSSQISALSPAGDLNAPPTEFRWEAVPGAAGYHLRLLEVDGTVVWEGDASGTSMAVPPAVSRLLVPARAFQWDVTAQDAAGRKLTASPLQSFHIMVTHP